MKIMIGLLVASSLVAGCASGTRNEGRVFIDSSVHEDSPPQWVKSTKVIWNDNDKIQVRTEHQVRGDERVNACFDLARLDASENVLTEIADDVKGTIDNSQTSVSENAEVVLGKARSSEFHGKITGLRLKEQYYTRYRIGDSERVECFSLSEMTTSDYNALKRSVVDQVASADPRIKEAITKKQIDFFKSATDREPSSK